MDSNDVTRFCRAVEAFGRIVRAQMTMNGMVASNMQRQTNGEAMAYWDSDFQAVIERERITTNDLKEDLLP